MYVWYDMIENIKQRLILGAYVSSSLARIPRRLSGGTGKKVQRFLGVLVGSLVAMLLRGTTRERSILPDMDQGGGVVGKCESGENGYLVVDVGGTQRRHRITDCPLFQLRAGAGYGWGIHTWACSIRIRNGHQGLGSNHGRVQRVPGIDGPRHPPVCWGDSRVHECYLQLPTPLVVGPVQVSCQLRKITTCREQPVRECLVSTRLSRGCHNHAAQNTQSQHHPQHVAHGHFWSCN